MRRTTLCLLALASVAAPRLGAQDSLWRGDSTEREQLRRRIEQRFAERVRQELELTNQQAQQLRATEERFRGRRRELLSQQMEARRAFEAQMRPGVGANPDSVKLLLDRLQAGRLALLQLDQEQDRDMAGYLTPVQRAQYQIMRERLLRRVAEMRRQGQLRGMGAPQRERP